jgi:hypothetical protein
MKVTQKTTVIAGILAAISLFGLKGNAQSNLVFYHNHEQFNSSDFNPAFLTSQKNFTFSIFPISGMTVGYNNQSVIKDMVFQIISGNQTKEEFTNIFNSLLKRDLFFQRWEMPILSFGVKTDLGSFDFRIKEIEQMASDFKGNFSEFLFSPAFQTLLLNQRQLFPAKAFYYREYSLGYAKEIIRNKLNIGIRAKLYFGKSNLISEVEGGIEQNNNQVFIKTYGQARLTVPFNLYQKDSLLTSATMSDNFTIANYLFNTKNMGAGIDLGFSYQISPQLQISASVVDLGRINWNNDVNTLIFKGNHKFPEEYILPTENDYVTKTPDFATDKENMNDLFKIAIEQAPYSTNLPATFYAGIQYQLNATVKIGAVDRFISSKKLNQNSFSLTASYKANKKLTINSGYSIIGNSYVNMPFALLYNRESSQSFIGTDNFLSFLIPSSDFSGITFGTCFFLFRHSSKYKSQLEYLPYFKEKKPKPKSNKGLIYNNYRQN